MVKRGSHHHNAMGVIGLLVLVIGFVLFYKLAMNIDAFSSDVNALRNYVVLSIVTMGFLLGLFFLATKPHPSHNPKSKSSKKRKSR